MDKRGLRERTNGMTNGLDRTRLTKEGIKA